MTGICRLSNFNILRNCTNLLRTQKTLCRGITTSSKKNDNTDVIESTEKKKWVSYGFNEEDERDDRRMMHENFFFSITLGIVITGFVLMYKPDLKNMTCWAQREAYLQMRYKEEHGLPYIDPNVVDPSKFTLPTDEELGDTEIII